MLEYEPPWGNPGKVGPVFAFEMAFKGPLLQATASGASGRRRFCLAKLTSLMVVTSVRRPTKA